MQPPQFWQSPDRITGLPLPFRPGTITCGSGQTLKQAPQSVQASRLTAATRTSDPRPISP